jgi:hypothetical protein
MAVEMYEFGHDAIGDFGFLIADILPLKYC